MRYGHVEGGVDSQPMRVRVGSLVQVSTRWRVVLRRRLTINLRNGHLATDGG